MKKTFALVALLALVLTAIAVPVAAQDDEAPTLRIAVLPVLNTLPLYVAQEAGFYEEEGVNVELIPFTSARDQQVAVQAGEVDGLNTDMAVQSLLVNGGIDLRAVRHEPIQEPYFSIVAGAESGIESIDDLRGVPIAISQNSIIEYLTTQMLLNAGFSEDEIVYEEVPAIPVRLELLAQGQVAAATLPEPLVTLATTLQGGTLIASDLDAVDFVPTVLAFNGDTLANNGEAVSAFLRAYESAVAAINTDGESYRDVMTGNLIIPEPLQPTLPVPTFPVANVPTEAETAQVVQWMIDNELLEEPLTYDALVDDSFLPEITLVDALVNSAGFSTLAAAAVEAGLVETLSDPEASYTIFAPTDAAFAAALEALDLTAEELLASEDLGDILAYHALEGAFVSGDVVDVLGEELETLNGASIVIEAGDAGLTINGTTNIILTDIVTSNGVIHVIDAVLLPPEE